ncbi:hypothetical protein CORC01_12064 [Colletotrichum orchidophilum]|uniref:Uncharacterized protein n=1 Tax=Colletotrichum orchidophilum TaxID=1209926 RepID=A0A1G4ATY8_9PEZI|nr:uncharacterized protein CORC01_12064 [Colletotrichum orchidophilum]OHE92618.1 hypothetical protein CORC01_12064 [Colletotrichum orchidophilum]
MVYRVILCRDEIPSWTCYAALFGEEFDGARCHSERLVSSIIKQLTDTERVMWMELGRNPSAGTQISGCPGKLSDKARIRVEQRLVDRALLFSPPSGVACVLVHSMQESAVRSRHQYLKPQHTSGTRLRL